MTVFNVHDLVGQKGIEPSADVYAAYVRQEVQIEITGVTTDRITAKVTALGDFFSAVRLGVGHGFVLGESLELTRGGGEDSWTIEEPRNRPWHVLSCHDGKKTFEHYR